MSVNGTVRRGRLAAALLFLTVTFVTGPVAAQRAAAGNFQISACGRTRPNHS